MRGGANSTKANALSEPDLTNDAPPTANARRPTRGKVWERIVEDLPLLDPPLEADSQTPVADALIRRLEYEEEKEGVLMCQWQHIIQNSFKFTFNSYSFWRLK